MKTNKLSNFAPSFKYTMVGILIGILFPLMATVNEITSRQLEYSWNSYLTIHKNPLLWIIDAGPILLGFFAYLAGSKQQKLVEQTRHLEELVTNRSKEIIRQKLFYKALVDNSPIAIATLDQNHNIIFINPAFQDLFGYRQEEIMGKDLDSLIGNPESPEEAYKITKSVWQGNAIHEFGKRKRKDGSLVEVEIFGEQIRVNEKRIGVLGLYRDITMEKQAQEALCASEERFRCMFSDSPVALRMEDFSQIKKWLDENVKDNADLQKKFKAHPEKFDRVFSLSRIIDLNDSTLFMFGARNKEEMQDQMVSLISDESKKDALGILDALLDGETTLERELVYNRIDGQKIYTITKLSIIPGYEKNWGRILFSNMDITERKLAEERLTYISLHDIMTGIYNRAFFEEEMSRLTKIRRYPISIIVLDMDNLKAINDKHGHMTGDIALQIMANIVKKCFRSEDVIARIGGDEIAILLQGVDDVLAERSKERILHEIQIHNEREGNRIPLSMSIGHATAVQGDLLTATFKTADARMYEEKKGKKNSPINKSKNSRQ